MFRLREESFSDKTFRAIAVDVDDDYKDLIQSEDLLIKVNFEKEVKELQNR